MRGPSRTGYRSRAEAVRALHEAGLAGAAIAERLGVPLRTVTARIGEQRPEGDRDLRRQSTTVELNYDLARQMRPHAARRDTRVNRLAAAIVEAVVERGLVDMVLAGREV